MVISREGEEGRGKIRRGDEETQTTMYKINRLQGHIYSTGNIANIL